jgi:Domain of unknown function (DUF4383)
MAHIPVNHPLRPFYRVLSGLVGLYVVLFGILGIIRTSGLAFFGRHGDWVLGLRTNPGFSVLSIIGGALLLLAAIIGGNLFSYLNLTASVIFMVVGIAMLLLLQTSANILAFSMATVIASFVFAIIAGLAGLYGKVGTSEQEQAEHDFRHAGAH